MGNLRSSMGQCCLVDRMCGAQWTRGLLENKFKRRGVGAINRLFRRVFRCVGLRGESTFFYRTWDHSYSDHAFVETFKPQGENFLHTGCIGASRRCLCSDLRFQVLLDFSGSALFASAHTHGVGA